MAEGISMLAVSGWRTKINKYKTVQKPGVETHSRHKLVFMVSCGVYTLCVACKTNVARARSTTLSDLNIIIENMLRGTARYLIQ